MKFAIARRLDRLRGTLERFTRVTPTDAAMPVTGLSHDDDDPAKHQAEMQFALQELRNLVLETATLDLAPSAGSRADSNVGPFSWASINFESRKGDLVDPTIENCPSSGSIPDALVSLTAQSLTMVAQQA